jgi:hypothetical protein
MQQASLTNSSGFLISLGAFFITYYVTQNILVCLSLGWPAGVRSILSMGEQAPSVWRSRGPHQILPMCSRLLGRLPSDETPGVSFLGCALLAVRACLFVLLCRAHPTKFLTDTCHIQPILLSYLVSDTRVPHFLIYRSSNQPDVAEMM